MKKSKKFFNKGKKGGFKPTTKKKRKAAQKNELVNKKALFNRYKNVQKMEEVLEKKKQMERKIQQMQVQYSESEEEEDAYGQLVSCFGSEFKKRAVVVSDDETESSEHSEEEDVTMVSDDDATKHNTLATNTQVQNSDYESDSGNEQDIEVNEVSEEEPDDESNDPFTKHLQHDLGDELLVSLTSVPSTIETVNKSWPVLGNLTIVIPKPVKTNSVKAKPKVTILEEKVFAATGTIPSIILKPDFNQLCIKSQIQGNIVSANKTNLIKKDLELTEVFTPLQKELFSIINNYQDLYYPERSFTNAEEIRYTYCLHAINHMLKTRTKILHHNSKLAKKNSDLTDDYRDQGLVRPKVLIMVPFKSAAYKVVNTIIDILVPKEAGQVLNKKRFEEDFTGGELMMPRKNPKPEDYELTFSGNTDDTFRLGMTVTKKTLKLYTEFYSSDIIITSPLGLRMIVGAEGEEDRDYDFLASIEVLVMDQTDVFLMQNWDHLLHVLDHFHLQPKKTHGTDFSRVRSWAVNGWAKYYRQTLIFSSVLLPEIKAVLSRKCHNYAGRVLCENPAPGCVQQVLVQVPMVFHRFNAANPIEAVEARFQYFLKEILPKQRDTLMSHTLIYIPSYFDYVRLRNYFKKEDIGFVQICEYSKEGKIARARDMFFHTEAHFLLYSERVHFFRRLRIKGVRHIIFYQPPTYPHFFSEMCNLMQEVNQNKYGGSECNMSVSVLHCRYDAARTAAVLGAARAARLATSDQPVHMYITGEKL